jgi:phage repressor protein C with HTH and peptisase S24 domain
LRDGIYALRSGGNMVVKRLTRNPATQGIAIKSDNPGWPDWEDCPPESLDIVGRVIWVGRELR